MGIIAASQKGSMQNEATQDPKNELIFIIQNISPISINNTIKGNSRILNCSLILIMLFRNISKELSVYWVNKKEDIFFPIAPIDFFWTSGGNIQ